MSSDSEAMKFYEAESKRLAEEARTITRKADAESRALTAVERTQVESIISQVTALKTRVQEHEDNERLREALDKASGTIAAPPGAGSNPAGPGGGGGGQLGHGLWHAAKSAGVEMVPGQVTRTLVTKDGLDVMDLLEDVQSDSNVGNDLPARTVPGVDPLPTVQRYIYPSIPTQSIDSTDGSVQYLQQTSRTLPEDESGGSVSDTILDFASTDEKPVVESHVELITELTHMNAVLTTFIPNALFGRQDLRAIIDSDARLALARGLDDYVAQGILNNPQSADPGQDIIEAIGRARKQLADTGYTATFTVINPEDEFELLFSRDNTDAFRMAQLPTLGRLVVSDAVDAGQPLAVDASAFTLYSGNLAVDVDGFTGFSQNLSRVRLEHPVLFVVKRADGAAQSSVESSS